MTLKLQRPKQQGVALISVLISVVILGFIMAALIARTNAHIRQMEAVKSRVSAEILADSQLHRILFLHASETEQSIDGWNYYDEPFALADHTIVRIKDTASMAAINNSITYSWRLLLPAAGYTSDEADRFLACLEDWQDNDNLEKLHGGESRHYQLLDKPGPRNGFIQSAAEIELVCGFKAGSAENLREHVTFIGTTYFNPLTASKLYIEQFGVGRDREEQIVEQRQDRQNTLNALARALDLSDGNSLWRYERPRRFSIDVKVEFGNAEARRSVVFNHNLRYNTAPIFQFWRWQE